MVKGENVFSMDDIVKKGKRLIEITKEIFPDYGISEVIFPRAFSVYGDDVSLEGPFFIVNPFTETISVMREDFYGKGVNLKREYEERMGDGIRSFVLKE